MDIKIGEGSLNDSTPQPQLPPGTPNSDSTPRRIAQQRELTPKQKEIQDTKTQRLLYAALPHRWVKDATRELVYDKQIEVMRAVARYPRIAVASANSCGKSFLASRLVPWWLSIYSDSIVVTTAPTTRQVENILWREIRNAYALALKNGVKLSKEPPLISKWEITEKHFAIGFAPKDYDSTTFQGLHSPHMLVIIDEAAGVSEEVYNGVLSVLRGSPGHLLAIGNPTTTSGWFYDAFRYPDRGWHTIHISAFDSPNVKAGKLVIPGIITRQDIEQAKIDYAGAPMLYKSLILGKFPDKAEDALIALEWIEAARERDAGMFPDPGYVQVGADIARFGSDTTVFTARRGGYGFLMEEHHKRNTMEVTGLLKLFATKVGAKVVAIDSIGLGAGVVDRCREVMPNLHVVEMQASERAEEPTTYSNAGTEWWSMLAGDLQMGRCGGPIFKDPRLTADLVGRRYKVRSDGVIQLESKGDAKKRMGRRSPDYGDSCALAYAQVFTSRKRAYVWGRDSAAA